MKDNMKSHTIDVLTRVVTALTTMEGVYNDKLTLSYLDIQELCAKLKNICLPINSLKSKLLREV